VGSVREDPWIGLASRIGSDRLVRATVIIPG
jgi:hypothetical protein